MEFQHKKQFGQNFLRNTEAILDFITGLQLTSDEQGKPLDGLLEIGPGMGAITEFLIERVNKLVLVEIDPELAAVHREAWADYPHVVVIESDILDVDLKEIQQKHGVSKVCGALPYNIGKQIIAKCCLDPELDWERAQFILQREVTEKYAGYKERNNGLHAALSTRWRTAILRNLERGLFQPMPKVNSAILTLSPRPEEAITRAQLPAFQKFLKQVFLQPRKKLRNNLKWLPEEKLASLPIDLDLRPEQLSNEQLLSLFQLLQS